MNRSAKFQNAHQSNTQGITGVLRRNTLPSNSESKYWLSTTSLEVNIGGASLLSEVTIGLEPKTLTAVYGPNGAGKSTLFKAIMGLMPFDGEVQIFGKPAKDLTANLWRKVAYLPQQPEIDWHFPITVSEVVEMGFAAKRPVNLRMNREERDLHRQVLRQLEITPIAHRSIVHASGGERKRMMLARAILQGADIFLLDEPFAALDVRSEALILEELRTLARRGKLVVVIHHDPKAIHAHFDQVIVLNKKVLFAGKPRKKVFYLF